MTITWLWLYMNMNECETCLVYCISPQLVWSDLTWPPSCCPPTVSFFLSIPRSSSISIPHYVCLSLSIGCGFSSLFLLTLSLYLPHPSLYLSICLCQCLCLQRTWHLEACSAARWGLRRSSGPVGSSTPPCVSRALRVRSEKWGKRREERRYSRICVLSCMCT